MVLEFISSETRTNDAGQKYAVVTIAAYENIETLKDGIDEGTCKRIMNVDDAVIGRRRFGTIETRDIAPYETNIDGRTVTVKKLTAVVFKGENVQEVMNAQLKRNNSSILVNGKPSVDYNVAAPQAQQVVVPQPENEKVGG
jgi:hypothetical protein